jgi:hypothetical protein
MNTRFAALVLALALSPALADEHPPVTKFSKASKELKLVERSDSYEKGSFARWKGRLTLTGKLILEFDRAPPEEPEHQNAGVAIFEPDAASRKKLPAATNYYELPVKEVYLARSPLEVLPALVGRQKAMNIVLSKTPHYEMPVSIVLTEFSTSVECDHRSYSMGYSSMRLLRPKVVALTEGQGTGC